MWPAKPCDVNYVTDSIDKPQWNFIGSFSASLAPSQTGLGVPNIFNVFLNFLHLSKFSKCWMSIWCHIHIWQVSLQFCCSAACQIWMWLMDLIYFCKAEMPLVDKILDGASVTTTLLAPMIVVLLNKGPVLWKAFPWNDAIMSYRVDVMNMAASICIDPDWSPISVKSMLKRLVGLFGVPVIDLY